MLNFFRKYQKIFFIFITGMIVISFTFFGTFSTFMQNEDTPKRLIGKSLDGKEVTDADERCILEFLQYATNREGVTLFDEVIVKAGLGQVVASGAFDLVKAELTERYQKLKKYSPYVHPQADFLSAKQVWARFAPEINELLAAIQTGPEELTAVQVGQMLHLYALQNRFPPTLLKQVLYFQQRQYTWIQQDPAIANGELGIGGFLTLEDWFGPKLLEELTIAVMNGAANAEAKGISVARKEAQYKLRQATANRLKEYSREGQITVQDIERSLAYQLRGLGLDESRAVDLWRRVLAFERDLQETASAIFVDRLPFDQRAEKAREEAIVRLYELPESLKFRDFRTLLKFESYIEAVSNQTGLDLPQHVMDAAEVEKRFPQLVERRVEAEIIEVTKTQVASKISLKETWDWQLDDKHFALLAKEFPLLGSKAAATREERFEALKTLDDQARLKVDQAARLMIASEHPEWIDDALGTAEWKPKTLSLRLKGGSEPFVGMKGGADLLNFLRAGKGFDRFSFDGEHFYALRLMTQITEPTLLTFEQALKDGTLDQVLDSILETSYPYMSKRSELKGSDGSVRPFEEVKDQLGALLFKDKLEAIRRLSGQEKLKLEEYAAHRFDGYLQEMQRKIAAGEKLPSSEWALVEKEESWMRGDGRFEDAENLQVGEWSKPLHARIFQVVEKTPGHASIEEIQDAQELLANEARLQVVKKTYGF